MLPSYSIHTTSSFDPAVMAHVSPLNCLATLHGSAHLLLLPAPPLLLLPMLPAPPLLLLPAPLLLSGNAAPDQLVVFLVARRTSTVSGFR